MGEMCSLHTGVRDAQADALVPVPPVATVD